MSALLGILGVVLDARFGEPQGWHPLVAFGRLADRLERRFNRSRLAGEGDPGVGWRSHGVTAWVLAVLPLTLLAWALAELPYLGWLVQALALYAALGLRSLGEHAEPVALALRAGDLDEARRRVGYLVSRDTRELDQAGVARAATESVLENGSDAVYAALFWFAVAGAPGVVLYRLSNTLDAMWGYRNARFERFGWAAAKIDDILNYLPARLVALTYALLGDTRQALRCWREQAPQWDSPNAGPVMAAGAGALGVSLGGAAIYHGELHQRPLLGSGPQPQGRDIYRALARVRPGVLLWLLWSAILQKMASDLGFSKILFGLLPKDSQDYENAFIVGNYPAAWREHYDRAGYARVDPTVSHCTQSVLPIFWEPSIYQTRKQHEFFEEASAAGLVYGLTMPLHGARGELGALSLSVEAENRAEANRFMESVLPTLWMLKDYALQSGAGLAFEHPVSKPVVLTSREKEVLQWCAIGKTSWEISVICNCSEANVNFHMGNIRRKFGVTSRRVAAIMAVNLGLITL
ncbi:cobalamin biosynthesis protein [Pseudomonas aeruginosa]|nr:cobalamin biosynthesis protein [Pseudomonas aeruginosa]